MTEVPARSQRMYAAAAAVIGWAALILQYYLIVGVFHADGKSTLAATGRFYTFFTVIGNTLATIVLTGAALPPHSRLGHVSNRPAIVAGIAVYMALIGITYNIILRQLEALTGAQYVAGEVLHVVMPVLVPLYWLLFVPERTITMETWHSVAHPSGGLSRLRAGDRGAYGILPLSVH